MEEFKILSDQLNSVQKSIANLTYKFDQFEKRFESKLKDKKVRDRETRF